MRILIDTNAYVRLRQGHRSTMEAVREAERMYLSCIVAGELLFGFHHGARFEENHRKLLAFIDSPVVDLVHVDLETADRFGRISTLLRRAGTPIPTNDIWIAAHAMQIGAELLTFDAHFSTVAGLAVRRLQERQ